MSKPLAVSPLAPDHFPDMPAIAGVRVATRACGVKYKNRTDVLLVEMTPETTVAGVFTRSLTASAPVDWCKKALAGGHGQALVVNSGNANAFTGILGAEAVERTVNATADIFGSRPSKVFVASTGVIGEQLADEKITGALSDLKADLKTGAWLEAAKAIMTTDTFPKGASRTAIIGDSKVNIVGIAKGSGMIAPDMATMLGFIFTDARLPHDVLQGLLSPAADRTFNSVTVDSDTSTSDTVLLFATGEGQAHADVDSADSPILDDFRVKLEEVMRDLAHQIVRDGEGATKFVTIDVTGAEDDAAAKTIGLAIANSPLVKTAIAGEDANWGRIVMAVGKAGEKADRDKLCIKIGGVPVAENGYAVEGYDETPVAKHMTGEEVHLEVDVGIANGRATVWTCDLTHGYISINADYRS